MALNANKIESTGSGNKTDPLESGNYLARVVQVLDMGIQEQRPYMGDPKPPANEISITYELSTEFLKDEDGNDKTDKPRWVSEIIPLYSLDVDLAKSTKRIKALDAENKLQGDFSKLVGLPCTLTLTQNEGKGKNTGKIYINVSQVTPPMKGIPVPPLVNEAKTFDLESPDLDVFNSLPDWLQTKIKGNLDFKGSSLSGLLGGSFATPPPQPAAAPSLDDDCPF